MIGKNAFLDLSSLLALPCYVFWKDMEGIYQGYNDYGAMNLGFHSGNEVVGKSDIDIFPKEHAIVYQSNDKQVVVSKSPVFASEEGELKNHCSVIFHSYKIPLYAEDRLLIGILGLSMALPAYKQGDFIIATENFRPLS